MREPCACPKSHDGVVSRLKADQKCCNPWKISVDWRAKLKRLFKKINCLHWKNFSVGCYSIFPCSDVIMTSLKGEWISNSWLPYFCFIIMSEPIELTICIIHLILINCRCLQLVCPSNNGLVVQTRTCLWTMLQTAAMFCEQCSQAESQMMASAGGEAGQKNVLMPQNFISYWTALALENHKT